MKVLHISYDLNRYEPRKDYTVLIEAIKSLGKVEKMQRSLWALSTSRSDIDVFKFLSNFVDPNDSLNVSEVASYVSKNVPAQALNLMDNTWDTKPVVLEPITPKYPIPKPYIAKPPLAR